MAGEEAGGGGGVWTDQYEIYEARGPVGSYRAPEVTGGPVGS